MTKTLARALSLALGLATMPAAAHTQTTAQGASACYHEHSYVMQATCVGATAASWPSDEPDQEPDVGEPQEFFLDDQGGINRCSRATTDVEVEWCAGELPASSTANPARFNCRESEVDSEYDFCGLPYPKRRR